MPCDSCLTRKQKMKAVRVYFRKLAKTKFPTINDNLVNHFVEDQFSHSTVDRLYDSISKEEVTR